MAPPLPPPDTNKSYVGKVQSLFGTLEKQFQRYSVGVQDTFISIRLHQQWFDYRTRPQSTFEILTRWKARKIRKELVVLIARIRDSGDTLGPSQQYLDKLERKRAEKASRPPANYRTIDITVEGEGGSFVMSFQEGQNNLSTGGFACIYVGHNKEGKKFALKRLKCAPSDPEYAEQERRITREKDYWMSFKHDHVLPLVGTCRILEMLFLVSPFMDNGTLFDFVVATPNAETPRLFLELAKAIEYLHGRDFVHGDIKGHNVMISDDCHALLGDFGISKPLWIDTSSECKGQGTLPFKAPELGKPGASKSRASDMYAFGITIASVMLHDTNPYPEPSTGHSITSMISRGIRPQRPQPSDSFGDNHAAVWDVAERCWSAEPMRRPTATYTVALLETVLRSFTS